MLFRKLLRSLSGALRVGRRLRKSFPLGDVAVTLGRYPERTADRASKRRLISTQREMKSELHRLHSIRLGVSERGEEEEEKAIMHTYNIFRGVPFGFFRHAR